MQTPWLLAVLVLSVLTGCGPSKKLTMVVTGGKGKVVGAHTAPTQCRLCAHPLPDPNIDCDETGGPTCSAFVPVGDKLSFEPAPQAGFHAGMSDCPSVMPDSDVSCTLPILACSAVCPSCAGAPAFDSSQPSAAVCAGSMASLTGTNLGEGSACVSVDGVPIVESGSVDAGSITFRVPPGTRVGNPTIALETSKGTATTKLLRVTTSPTHTSVVPLTGAAGTTVVIEGSHLLGMKLGMISDDGTLTTELFPTVTANTDTQVTFAVPAAIKPGVRYWIDISTPCGFEDVARAVFTGK